MAAFGPMEPTVLVPLEEDNGEAIWCCIVQQIVRKTLPEVHRALFPYHRRGPMHWILAFAVGEGKLPFAISAPLSRKQKILLSLTPKVCWEDLAPKELGFLFEDLVTINFSREKE